MRKLKLQVQISIDGFIAGPNGEMDFMVWDWDDQLKNYVATLTEPVDCILLGRKLAEGFIPYWSGVAADESNPESAAGKKFTHTKKVVFTKTLERSLWDNTVLAKGELLDEVNRLKNEEGSDMIVYGGATFVSALIREKLIDELHLFVNPSAIGSGMPVFKEGGKQELELVNVTSFACGIVVLQYTPRRS